jgi:organic radical activating enzyme
MGFMDYILDKIDHNVEELIHRGMGRVFTFSIVVGTKACNANCPFCISKTTGFSQLPPCKDFDVQRLRKAARLAQMRNATTVLFTGKGEPFLYPKQILKYLTELQPYDFPIIEIQTNALNIADINDSQIQNRSLYDDLKWMKYYGLNTIAISVVDVDQKNNAKIYRNPYPDLAETVSCIHNLGFSVRLCVMMQKGMVDCPEDIGRVVEFCKNNSVEQCTVRPIKKPDRADDTDKYVKYINEYGLTKDQISNINSYIRVCGKQILTIAHGAHSAQVFDIDGQNIAISDCLTVESNTDDIRTLIYYPSGEISYDWGYKGARIM